MQKVWPSGGWCQSCGEAAGCGRTKTACVIYGAGFTEGHAMPGGAATGPDVMRRPLIGWIGIRKTYGARVMSVRGCVTLSSCGTVEAT